MRLAVRRSVYGSNANKEIEWEGTVRGVDWLVVGLSVGGSLFGGQKHALPEFFLLMFYFPCSLSI
jgi:hypothetical protein